MAWVGKQVITESRTWLVYVDADSLEEARRLIDQEGKGHYYAYVDSQELARGPVEGLEDDPDIPGMGM